MKFATLLMCLVLTGCAHNSGGTPIPSKLHSVALRWDPSSSFITGGQYEYRIYRGSPDCSNVILYASGLSDSNYVDNNVNHKTTYCYQVSVLDKTNKNENRGVKTAVVTVP